MKKIIGMVIVLMLFGGLQTTQAQLLKKIKKRAERSIEKKVGKEIDDAVNKDKKSTDKKEDKKRGNEDGNKPKSTDEVSPKSEEIWRNYKFVPGEKVIFFDDLLTEEVGEFPSRWDLVKGGMEVARFNGEKVIIGTAEYNNRMIPLFKDENYLSDEFTIEFDVYVDDLSKKNNNFWASYNIFFTTKGYQDTNRPDVKFHLRKDKTNGHVGSSDFKIEEVALGELNQWHHIALSYYKGKFKLYYDDNRIINLPKLPVVPDIFALDFSGYGPYDTEVKVAVKNVRIAHGGGQMYKRILADGKYVTQGILFDTGKAVVKPESYGVISKLKEMMNDNAEWNFEIIGHTDSDGDTESNLLLAKKRANAVKQALLDSGIVATRLTASGKGENEPLNTNKTPEEKANNRRVEFVLKK